jgi:hypothetical protein
MSAEAEKRQKGCSSTEPEIVVDHDGPDRVDFGTIGGVTTGKEATTISITQPVSRTIVTSYILSNLLDSDIYLL